MAAVRFRVLQFSMLVVWSGKRFLAWCIMHHACIPIHDRRNVHTCLYWLIAFARYSKQGHGINSWFFMLITTTKRKEEPTAATGAVTVLEIRNNGTLPLLYYNVCPLQYICMYLRVDPLICGICTAQFGFTCKISNCKVLGLTLVPFLLEPFTNLTLKSWKEAASYFVCHSNGLLFVTRSEEHCKPSTEGLSAKDKLKIRTWWRTAPIGISHAWWTVCQSGTPKNKHNSYNE